MYLAKLVGVGVAIAVVCAAASGTSRADENEFLDRFHGMWVGSGSVIQNGEPMRVSCHVAGLPVAHRIHIDGNCNISLFSRSFAAELTYNPTTGFYSGVYTGAKVGPARLSGQRKGSAVYLTVTWPRPVHGDTKATMTIENTGRGVLRVGLSDNAVVGGIMLRSDFIFSQR